jgi:hypothetical protein
MKYLLWVTLFLAVPAMAQTDSGRPRTYAVVEVAYPEAPSALWAPPALPVVAVATKKGPAVRTETHGFLDRPAKFRFAILAGFIAADGITTQQVLNKGGHELNPVARPFVTHGAAGQLAASSIGYGAAITTSYLFHRTKHHKLERLFENAAIGIESECVVDNLVQGALIRHSVQQ